MKRLFALTAALACLATPALADKNVDDARWIAECVTDNRDQNQTGEVITKYCTCMNGKMSDSEQRSITEWEKANPNEMEACSKEAGWKGK